MKTTALLLCLVCGAWAFGGPPPTDVQPLDRDPGADTVDLWLQLDIPEGLEEAGIKVGGNEEVFLSFAAHLREQLTDGRTPPGRAGELDAAAFALWFLTGGADREPVFYLPACPGLGIAESRHLAPVEAAALLDGLEPADDASRRRLREIRQRLGFIAGHSRLADLLLLAPPSEYDNRWRDLNQGSDPLAVDAARSDFERLTVDAEPAMLEGADASLAQLEDQAALYGLAAELTGAARTGDPAATQTALSAFYERLVTANDWREGYPAEEFRSAYATYKRLPLYDWAHYAYALAGLLFLIALILNRSRLAWLGIGAVGLGFVAHAAFLALRWYLSGHSPTSGMFEFLALLSWSIVGVYLYFALRREMHQGGLGVVLLVFALWLLSDIRGQRIVQQIMPALDSVWMTLHVGLVAIGEGILGVGFIFAVLYLIKSYSADPAKPGRLPTAATLSDYTYRSLSFAFPFYAVGGILAGMIWAEQAWGTWWSWDPKETLALFVGIVLLLYLHARRVGDWRDRRLGWLALAPFLVAVLNLLSNLIIRGLHAYG
jgi:cytochrome c-type biogenesis protein CcsB